MPPFLKSGVHEGLNIRFGPSDDYPISSLLKPGVEADVIGYNPRPLWYKIAVADGRIGWVYSASAQLFGVLDNTPVMDELPMVRIMTYSLVVHPEPDLNSPGLGVVRLGSVFYIVGRDSKLNFWKIQGKFGQGWVAAGFTATIGNTKNVPVLSGPAPLPVLQ
jgi:SH3-like domain-containing protein